MMEMVNGKDVARNAAVEGAEAESEETETEEEVEATHEVFLNNGEAKEAMAEVHGRECRWEEGDQGEKEGPAKKKKKKKKKSGENKKKKKKDKKKDKKEKKNKNKNKNKNKSGEKSREGEGGRAVCVEKNKEPVPVSAPEGDGEGENEEEVPDPNVPVPRQVGETTLRTQIRVVYKGMYRPVAGVPPRLAFVENAFRRVTKAPGMEGLDARGVADFMSAHVADCKDMMCPIVGGSGGRTSLVPHYHLHDVEEASSEAPPCVLAVVCLSS